MSQKPANAANAASVASGDKFMWKRQTWHECAEELDEVCQRFRDASWGRKHGSGWPRHPGDEKTMEETSLDGVRILQALAVGVRAEQDYNPVQPGNVRIGALKERGATPDDVTRAMRAGGLEGVLGFEGYTLLGLRAALNKIVHADPALSKYYVAPENQAHDLLLTGTYRRDTWFAVISLLRLIAAIKALPDAAIG